MKRTHRIRLGFVCCLVIVNGVLLEAAAWGDCTVEQRIELGKQGYGKDEVEKACAGDEKNDGENFWEALTKDVVTGLANGLTDSLSKGLNNALVGRERGSQTSALSTNSANACVTNAGACPLSGVPSGAPCYCQTWNGATFYGIAK